jgi:hypothetical protein
MALGSASELRYLLGVSHRLGFLSKADRDGSTETALLSFALCSV